MGVGSVYPISFVACTRWGCRPRALNGINDSRINRCYDVEDMKKSQGMRPACRAFSFVTRRAFGVVIEDVLALIDGEEIVRRFLMRSFPMNSEFVFDTIANLIEDNPNSDICKHVLDTDLGV